jgi:hypothetical protein
MRKPLFLTLSAMGFLFCSCRFKAPTIEEQRELMARGSFGSSAPAWVAKPVTMGSQIKNQGPSIIPLELGTATSDNVVNSSPPVAQRSSGESEVEASSGSDSALSRINRLCPDLEREVNTAITTVDILARIKHYKNLTNRCPNSDDLWLWLAEEYFEIGDNINARHSAERALSINSSNDQAKILLERISKNSQVSR